MPLAPFARPWLPATLAEWIALRSVWARKSAREPAAPSTVNPSDLDHMRIATPSTRLTRLVQLATAACTLLLSGAASAQTAVDSALLSYINGIRAIDVHAHPMRPVAANTPPDTEFDALPLDGIPAFAVPHRLTDRRPHLA
jgi:hypothetical protein